MNQPLSSPQLLELLDQVHHKLAAVEREKSEPIAIIGVSCRFPGNANDPDSFWQLLREGVDAVTEIPSDRWDVDAFYDPDPAAPLKIYTRHGSFIREVDQFDPLFFGISPREAVSLDPQQRLLLEVTWEALENAGMDPNQLRNSATGVYVGICTDDYVSNQTVNSVTRLVSQYFTNQEIPPSVDTYTGIGGTRSIAVGRISHFLGFQGPNIQLDTACSSSLVAVHLACQSLRLKECNLALVGGVNLILSPGNTFARCQIKALAPDGRCKAFAASADGYGQGEGCGMVVLKRLSDAQADGDTILAVIRGSSTNHDGPSGGLTVPNKRAQQEVIQQALKNARVEPHQVSYVEAHGTGTTLGDPIELEALAAVYGKNRPTNQPLVVGSVKTNFGHLEAAAGISSLIKAALALHHQEIPPHLHFNQPNPYIPWQEIPVVIPTSVMPWKQENRLAGVSSFGMSGSNVHLILEQAPEPVQPKTSQVVKEKASESSVNLLTLSAKTAKALDDLVICYRNHLEVHPEEELVDICYTANSGRAHFQHRLAVLATSKAELREKLASFKTHEEVGGIFSGEISNTSGKPKIAFLFTGQGSQYVGMGRDLYENQPIFRQVLEQCDAILRPYREKSLLEVLYPETTDITENGSLLDQTAYAQPALFALEYALAQLWQSWGIKPDVVIGHSVGEYVAACVAGVFSLEDGLKLIAARGQLMQQLPPGGEMVSVLATESQVREAIKPYSSQVNLAAINGPESIVISGVGEAVQAICQQLAERGIKTKPLQVSHAFHSHLMEPMLGEFTKVAQQITYYQPRLSLISNLTGEEATKDIANPNYWVNHIRQPVRFAQGMEILHQQGYKTFLEIGPKPIMLGMARQCLRENQGVWLASLQPPKSESLSMLSSLAQLYVQGCKVDWSRFYQGDSHYKVQLPTYPFQRQRYWIESVSEILKQIELLPNVLVNSPEKQQQQSANIFQDWLYQLEWKPVNISRHKKDLALSHWLIFADQSGLAIALKNQLQELGHQCSLVYRNDTEQNSEPGIYQINPSHPQEFEQLYQAITATSQLPLEKIIHLWSLDSNWEENLTASALEQSQLWGCGSVLHLLQAVVKNSPTTSPKFWLVTRGSQAVSANQIPLAITQSSLWSLGRVLSWEHPQLWGGLVDLDPQGAKDEAHKLLELLGDNQQLDHLALRDRQLYQACLVKYDWEQEQLKNEEPLFNSDATYLITGGLGALGLDTAAWMVSKGAKHLGLLSRNPASEQAQQKIKALEKLGAKIHILLGDVSLKTDLVQLLEQVQQPPLRGVIHAAGVLADGVLQQMSWEDFTRVTTPKVKGAWYLHELTQHLPLDFFVCFSSMASLVGSPGQGNYAAANGFMDGLAHYRRQLGLPGLSINWGAWSEVGMASRVVNQYQTRWKMSGIGSIAPEQGLQILEQLLRHQSPPQVGVLPADWSILREQWRLRGSHSLLAELLQQQPNLKQQHTQGILEKLKAAEEIAYPQILRKYLQALVAKILQINPAEISPQANLVELGMDSLMTMEIVNQLSQDLNFIIYPREFYERPKIEALTEYLTAELRQKSLVLDPDKNEIKTLEIFPGESSSDFSNLTPSSERLPGIIFILSSPRSGSTLLRVMLGGHSSLFSPPELHLLPFATMSEREEQLNVSHLGEGLQKALMEIYNLDAVASEALIKDRCLQNWSVEQMYQEIQETIYPRVLVDKSPSYAINRTILERGERIFENSKYIYLVRHPYSVIESFVRMRMQKLAGLAGDNPYQIAEEIWTKSNQNILDFLSQIEPERQQQICYEDLVKDPNYTLSQLCDFLKINFESALLQPYQGERMTKGVHEGSLSISDPNFLRHNSIDSTLGNKWKTIQLPYPLGEKSRVIAQKFNYELPNPIDSVKDTSITLKEKKPPLEEKFLEFRDKQICLCNWGVENNPIILCIHGILEQGLAWQEVAQPLAAKGYWVVAPDLFGHGRSAHLDIATAYNPLTFLAQIDWIIQQLPDQPLFLVGHSMGAMLAAMIASVRPEKIKRLMLVEPPLPAEDKKSEPVNQLTTFLENFISVPQHPIFPDVATGARRLRQVTPALSEEFSYLLAQRTTKACEGGFIWSWDAILRLRSSLIFNSYNGGRLQYLSMLKQIKIPTTLVYGDSSKMNRPEDLQEHQTAMAQAKRFFVSGGHNLHIEAADALISLIEQEGGL